MTRGAVSALAAFLALPVAAKNIEACKAIADAEERLACFDALDPSDTPDPAKAETAFPLHDRLDGPFRNWEKGTRFKLKNGQVWKSVDDRSGYYTDVPDDAKVSITETWFGAFWLRVEGADAKIRVKRIK